MEYELDFSRTKAATSTLECEDYTFKFMMLIRWCWVLKKWGGAGGVGYLPNTRPSKPLRWGEVRIAFLMRNKKFFMHAIFIVFSIGTLFLI